MGGWPSEAARMILITPSSKTMLLVDLAGSRLSSPSLQNKTNLNEITNFIVAK